MPDIENQLYKNLGRENDGKQQMAECLRGVVTRQEAEGKAGREE